MAKRAALAADSEVLARLIEIVNGTDEPVPISKLKSALKGPMRRSEEQIRAILAPLLVEGRMFEYPPATGKSPRFWRCEPAAYARRLVETALAAKPLPLKDIAKQCGKRLKGFEGWEAILAALERDARLHRIPPATPRGGVRYSFRPADPKEFLVAPVRGWKKTLEKIASNLAPYGIDRERVVAAAVALLGGQAVPTAAPSPPRAIAPQAPVVPAASIAPVDFASRFERAFQEIDRRKGSHNFVSLVDLRPALADVAREAFDRGLRELRLSGRYELIGAEGAGGLGDAQRGAGIEEAGMLLLYVARK